MQAFDFNFLILLFILALGFFSQNMAIIIASALLIILKITPFNPFLPFVAKNSLNWGVVVLTVGVLAPIASGTIDGHKILKKMISFNSLIAIVIGVLVAWIAGKGVKVMTSEADVLIALMIGTITGVMFFRGLPVGPLIAAGIYAIIKFKV